MAEISVLLADDHPLLRTGTETLMKEKGLADVVFHANNGLEALNVLVEQRPSIAFVDFEMPLLNGIEVLTKAIESGCKTPIVIVSIHKELTLLHEIRARGGAGYLTKDQPPATLIACANAILAGKKWFSMMSETAFENEDVSVMLDKLSRMERKILKLISNGLSTIEIAEALFISPKTVENHRRSICKKLELEPKSNTLLIWAVENKQLLQFY
ncbi:MAG: response regulator transcription factor [Salibacteraceae bacterium]